MILNNIELILLKNHKNNLNTLKLLQNKMFLRLKQMKITKKEGVIKMLLMVSEEEKK